MQRAQYIAGRATTCWKAHREGNPTAPLVMKDSWQYPERGEEGDVLHEVTNKGVVNTARYYYHETVQVRGIDDDTQGNIRGGLDATKAANYRERSSICTVRKDRSGPGASKKRSSSQAGATLHPSKRSCSTSTPTEPTLQPPNRIHRRIVLRDFGKPIYTTTSRTRLLATLEGYINGHESLREAGFLHRDISINNLMINENNSNSDDDYNPSWSAFLIDLDLAVREQREGASGARCKTGTRAFIAIGALLSEKHSFTHDLKSFLLGSILDIHPLH